MIKMYTFQELLELGYLEEDVDGEDVGHYKSYTIPERFCIQTISDYDAVNFSTITYVQLCFDREKGTDWVAQLEGYPEDPISCKEIHDAFEFKIYEIIS